MNEAKQIIDMLFQGENPETCIRQWQKHLKKKLEGDYICMPKKVRLARDKYNCQYREWAALPFWKRIFIRQPEEK